jgi:tRNA dimethylallyltransferase
MTPGCRGASGQTVAGEAYVLVGPTASGKTAAAEWIARHGGYGILSADSMLVYRGMDIGTAKPAEAERAAVPHWGLDLVAVGEPFSVALYLEAARKAVAECRHLGLRLIVVGGTGLYVRALTEGLEAGPPPDPEARRHWEQVARDGGVAALRAALERLDPAALDGLSDSANPRRLIRALERAGAGLPAALAPGRVGVERPLLAGLACSREELAARILARARCMFAKGVLEETARLRAQGLEQAPTAAQAIGYAEALACLRGDSSMVEAIERTAARTRQLAKRQMTWFRHQARVEWIEAGAGVSVEETGQRVLEAWGRSGPAPLRM